MSSPPKKPEDHWRAPRDAVETGASASSSAAANRALRPQDAATLIIVDSDGPPRILMGRRHSRQVFLPNKYVFPGGRADKVDRRVPSHDELDSREQEKLLLDMKGSPSAIRARGLAMAAVRETFEETGVLVGATDPTAKRHALEAGDATDLGGGWHGFLSEDTVPRLAPLKFLARAITPPGRPRRYDTRFFLVDACHIAKQVKAPDDELGDVGWFTIEELRQLDLPNITRAVVEDLNDYMALQARGGGDWAAPFYYFKAGSFERVLLA